MNLPHRRHGLPRDLTESLPHPYYGSLSGSVEILPSSRSLNPLPSGELLCLKSRDLRDGLQYPNQLHFNGHSPVHDIQCYSIH